MEGEVLRDDQWEKVKPFVPGGRKGKRGPRSDGRRSSTRSLDGTFRRAMARPSGEVRPLSDGQAALLPLDRGGVFDRLFEALADDPDLEWLAIDATVIRAQAQAAGARRKGGI